MKESLLTKNDHGGYIPPDLPPVDYGKGNGEEDEGKVACTVALLLCATRLRLTYDQVFFTKRGHYAGKMIEAGQYKDAAKMLDKLNSADLRYYAKE